MKREILIGLGLAGLAATSMVASRVLGSRPDEPGYNGPLPTCGDTPNCYRGRVSLAASPDAVREAALTVVRDHRSLITGRPLRVTPTDDGLTAVFQSGPFRDDVALAVAPDAGGGSVLHVRSAARVGESDIGVNRRRARQILSDVEDLLAGA